MNILIALNSLLLLFAPINTQEVEVTPISFRVQVYPFGGYYSYPPTCPPGYYYGPGGCYWGGRYYRPYYPYSYYRPYYRHYRHRH